jgi:hypothetical protein
LNTVESCALQNNQTAVIFPVLSRTSSLLEPKVPRFFAITANADEMLSAASFGALTPPIAAALFVPSRTRFQGIGLTVHARIRRQHP